MATLCSTEQRPARGRPSQRGTWLEQHGPITAIGFEHGNGSHAEAAAAAAVVRRESVKHADERATGDDQECCEHGASADALAAPDH